MIKIYKEFIDLYGIGKNYGGKINYARKIADRIENERWDDDKRKKWNEVVDDLYDLYNMEEDVLDMINKYLDKAISLNSKYC